MFRVPRKNNIDQADFEKVEMGNTSLWEGAEGDRIGKKGQAVSGLVGTDSEELRKPREIVNYLGIMCALECQKHPSTQPAWLLRSGGEWCGLREGWTTAVKLAVERRWRIPGWRGDAKEKKNSETGGQ